MLFLKNRNSFIGKMGEMDAELTFFARQGEVMLFGSLK